MSYFTHRFEATVSLHPVGTYNYTVVYLDPELHESLPLKESPRLRRRVPTPVPGSAHELKYRLAYVVDSVCVVRYDNEVGKGDHRHFGVSENSSKFSTPERLMVDFQKDIARWNDENSSS